MTLTHRFADRRTTTLAGAVALAAAAFMLLSIGSPSRADASCAASSGGLSIPSSDCAPVKKARLINGKAIAPASAPPRVKKVIKAANKIRNKPYVYGGGHGSFNDSGYDCSGSVSYALRGGKFISSPLASTGYMNWKKGGEGKWISVYSNPSHAYMIVAGLRFDTSMTSGDGPGWSKSHRSTSGSFKVRHPGNY